MAPAWGAFWGTRVLEIVKKHDSGGLVWKRIKLTSTRKANAKKRLRRVWQECFLVERKRYLGAQHQLFDNEAVLRACSEPPSPGMSRADGGKVASEEN